MTPGTRIVTAKPPRREARKRKPSPPITERIVYRPSLKAKRAWQRYLRLTGHDAG